jgi:hypothetical protein
MLTEQTPESKPILKNPFLYSSIAVGIALAVVGWIFFSRWQENRGIERRALEERTQKQQESDRAAVEQLGGNDLAIQMFYVSPTSIRRGEAAQLCYGVANAKTIKLEPESNVAIWSSHNRCIDVTPKKTTSYTLTIASASGETKAQSVEVKVR